MRSVLIISLSNAYGGAERSIEIVAARLQQEVRLTILASWPNHVAALRGLLRPPSRVIQLQQRRGRRGQLMWAGELLTLLALHRPDAIVVNTNISANALATAARLWPGLSARAFIYVRDFVWGNFEQVFGSLKGAHVLIPGPALLDRADYLAHHLVPRGSMKFSVVPNAVCLPNDAASPTRSDRYVLHLAAANLWKGHYHLVRAAALLRDRGLPIRFISRGAVHNPGLWRALHRLILQWKLTSAFALWDAVDDPSDLLRGCLCVVVPSVSRFGGPESFGRTIVEAWAHGKPVVAFDAGGAHHLIEDKRDGLLVPEGNIEALADALQTLWQQPDLCRRLGENGLAKVRESFTAETVVKQLRTVLRV